MTASLALVDNGEALPGLLRDDGYVLPPAITFERWRQVGVNLQQMQRSVNWWAGDWLRFGEDRWGEEAYQAVADLTGHGDDSLKQAVWVSSRFPPSTRVPSLSWAHHRAAASLEPETRAAVLRDAMAGNLSTRELIARVKVEQEKARAVPSASEPVCAADASWTPELDDLLPEWQADLQRRARSQPEGYVRGWLDCLRETGNEAAFKPDRWRD